MPRLGAGGHARAGRATRPPVRRWRQPAGRLSSRADTGAQPDPLLPASNRAARCAGVRRPADGRFGRRVAVCSRLSITTTRPPPGVAWRRCSSCRSPCSASTTDGRPEGKAAIRALLQRNTRPEPSAPLLTGLRSGRLRSRGEPHRQSVHHDSDTFQHEALLYAGSDEFVSRCSGFIRAGLDDGSRSWWPSPSRDRPSA